MTALGEYLARALEEKGTATQGKRLSLRQAEVLTGVSHNHIRAILTGIDTRTHKPFEPGPSILRKLADGLGLPYLVLMQHAGYLTENDLPVRVLEVLSEPKYRPLVETIQSNPDALVVLIGVMHDIIQNP